MRTIFLAILCLVLLPGFQTVMAAERQQPPWGLMEKMRPDDLEEVIEKAPVAFVPLGTFEHHGWHLPVCFDGIKAHALCERVAKETGGAVLPTFFYGTGGGHVNYKWTIILPEEQIRPILATTLDQLSRFGFKAVVILTGHYPREQVDMVHELAEEAAKRNPGTRYIGLAEREITTPLPGDNRSGDHAGKYETSIAMELKPDWVRLDYLTPDHDPKQVTMPNRTRTERPTHDPKNPLYAIYGQDPRNHASPAAGKKVVAEIVRRLAEKVENALKGTN